MSNEQNYEVTDPDLPPFAFTFPVKGGGSCNILLTAIVSVEIKGKYLHIGLNTGKEHKFEYTKTEETVKDYQSLLGSLNWHFDE